MTPKLIIDNVRHDYEASRAAQAPRVGGGDGGDHMDGMSDRVSKVEHTVAKIEGSLDWAKLVATIVLGVMLAGFSLLAALTFSASNRSDASASKLEAQIAGVSTRIADEFRAQRQTQSAEITAISNAMTATKQQAPQVILLPTPSADPKAKSP